MKEKKSEPNESCAGDRLKAFDEWRADDLSGMVALIANKRFDELMWLSFKAGWNRRVLDEQTSPFGAVSNANDLVNKNCSKCAAIATEAIKQGDIFMREIAELKLQLCRVPEQQPNVQKMREALKKLDDMAWENMNDPTSTKTIWAIDIYRITQGVLRAALSEQPQQNLGELGAVE